MYFLFIFITFCIQCLIHFLNFPRRICIKRILASVLALVFAKASIAAVLDSYQVTGPANEVKENMVTVKKDKEKWQIAIDKDTRKTGDIKVGSLVTIKYQMKVASIEVKDAAKKEAKKEVKKEEKKDAKKK